MTVKLSDKQIKALEVIEDVPGFLASYTSPIARCVQRLSGESLCRLGFAARQFTGASWNRICITDAGILWLAEYRKGNRVPMSTAAPQRAFGWRPDPDVRDLAYPMRAVVNLEAPLPPYKFWPCREALNQGSLGACVGASCRGWMEASPLMRRIGDGWTWRQIYDWAQENDGFAGKEPEMSGTSLRAGMQALQEAGEVASYIWATTMEEAKTFIAQRGPVIFGSAWYSGMMQPDSSNTIHATGTYVGGHAYLVCGVSVRRGLFRIQNSWSRQWGVNGKAWISEADLAKLFTAGGEAVAAVEAGG